MKKLIAFLLASSLAACSGGSGPGGSGSAVPAYYATFEGADLGCCIVRDIFHKPPQPMAEGRSNVGEMAALNSKDGLLQMVLTAPAPLQKDDAGNPKTPSMGIFGTGYDFGQGTNFTVSATFQKPERAASTDSWTDTVVARTGGVADTPDLGRIQLSLRVKGGQAELRVQEGLNDATTGKLPGASAPVTGAAYDEIYKLGQPYTLKLHVNRQNGTGNAALTTKTQTIPVDFTMGVFTQSAGDPLTTVGAALANTGPGLTASVEVADFKVWGPPAGSRVPRTTSVIRKPVPGADPSRKAASGA